MDLRYQYFFCGSQLKLSQTITNTILVINIISICIYIPTKNSYIALKIVIFCIY